MFALLGEKERRYWETTEARLSVSVHEVQGLEAKVGGGSMKQWLTKRGEDVDGLGSNLISWIIFLLPSGLGC